MKTRSASVVLTVMLLSIGIGAFAQNHSWRHYDNSGYLTRDSISKKGYTLIFINLDSSFSKQVKSQMIQTFFKVYPKEAKRFNPNTAKKVLFIIDPKYKGIAATASAATRFNPQWFVKHPKDIDVVTHEVMHIVQGYHFGHVPGWLTEGIADFARYTYGVANKAAGWTLTAYNPKQSYKNAYRITARFLVWVQKNYGKSIVTKLNAALREGKYTNNLWKELTGKTVDELWENYGKNPALKLHYR